MCGREVSVKASPETVSIYIGGTCIAQHKRCLERKKTIYDLAHYLSLLEKKGRAIFYAKPVQETIPEFFLHWLRSQALTSRELVDILRRCQEEDYMEVMKEAPNHIDPVEIQDTVIVQTVDLHLYDAFLHGKAGACQRREKNNVKRREEIDANAGIKNAGIPTAGCKPPVNCLPESRPGAR